MNIEEQDYGTTSINYDLSCSFLALQPVSYAGESGLNTEYYQILICFELLCSTNLRDLFYAKNKLSSIVDGEFQKKYKFVYMALVAWTNQNIEESRYYLIHHLKSYHSDVVAYHMLHMIDFITGNYRGYLEYLNSSVKVKDAKLQGFLNGVISFSLIENGITEQQAKKIAEKAISENSRDIYSLHALVHYLHMDGDNIGIITYLEKCKVVWIENNGMNMHIFWHLSLAYLNLLDVNISFGYFKDFYSLKPSPIGEYDLDAANYLWRLFLLDESNEHVIKELEKCSMQWAPSIGNSISYFNDMHAMLCFVAIKNTTFCTKTLNKDIIHFNDEKANSAGREILQALYHYKEKNYQKSINHISKVNDFSSIGGSYAQREVIYLTLAKAYIKIGQRDKAKKVIIENFPHNFINSKYAKRFITETKLEALQLT